MKVKRLFKPGNFILASTMLCLLIAFFLTSFTAFAVGLSLNDERLGRKVRFSNIEGEVQVSPLVRPSTASNGLQEFVAPADIIEKFVTARDVNASWLICARRHDYESISYDLVVTSPSGDARSFLTSGRYDRGIFLLLPSEYILYYGDVGSYKFTSDEESFRVTVVPADFPDTGIPSYRHWLSLTGLRPLAWQGIEAKATLLEQYSSPEIEYELSFDTRSLLLTGERILYHSDVHKEGLNNRIKAEVNYQYDENKATYPTALSLVNYEANRSAQLHFEMVQGFWLLFDGTYIQGLSNEDLSRPKWNIRNKDIQVVRANVTNTLAE